MKALLQTGSSGRVPVPPEKKRFLVNFGRNPTATGFGIGSTLLLRTLRHPLAIVVGAFLSAGSVLPGATNGELEVPAAQRAIEQYEAAVRDAEAHHRNAVERAEGRASEEALLQRADDGYVNAIAAATAELDNTLEWIEDWLLAQVERLSSYRVALESTPGRPVRGHDSDEPIAVPDARQAIERYAAALDALEDEGRSTIESEVNTTGDERVDAGRNRSIEELNTELAGELHRIENWVHEQVELLGQQRENAGARLAHARSPTIVGTLYLCVRGEADVFRNGEPIISEQWPRESELVTADVRLKSGDFLVLRVLAPYTRAWSFRAIIVANDGTMIPVNQDGVKRFEIEIAPDELTLEHWAENGLAAPEGRGTDGMIEIWDDLGFEEDESTWIRIPSGGFPFVFGFPVP